MMRSHIRQSVADSVLVATGMALFLGLEPRPAAVADPFGNRGSDPIPGHGMHNQAPEAALPEDEMMDLEITVENASPPGPFSTSRIRSR